MPPPVKQFKLLSKDIRARSSSYSCWHRRWHRRAVLHLSCPHLSRTWRPRILEFHISISIMTPFAQLASQAYVERVFSVCGHLTAGKRNRLCKKLANRAFLKVNNKFYDWLHLTVEHCVIYNWNWNWKTTTEITLWWSILTLYTHIYLSRSSVFVSLKSR